MEEDEGPLGYFSLAMFIMAAAATCINLYISIDTRNMLKDFRDSIYKPNHVVGQAYMDTCKAALHVATRNASNNDSYQGHGYSDSKAAGEDAHYHDNPGAYDGRSSG